MPIFRSKPKTIDAEQFRDPTNPPRGVQEDDPGKFYVTTMQGVNVPVKVGEWIVLERDGKHCYPIADGEFQKLYE